MLGAALQATHRAVALLTIAFSSATNLIHVEYIPTTQKRAIRSTVAAAASIAHRKSMARSDVSRNTTNRPAHSASDSADLTSRYRGAGACGVRRSHTLLM